MNKTFFADIGSKIGGLFRKLISGVKNACTDVTTHWKTPAEGRYVGYREVAFLAIGCAGTIIIKSIDLSFGVGCFLVGAIYKLSFRDLYIIGLINMPLTFIYNPMNMIVTDNLGRVPKKTLKWMVAYLIPSMCIGLGIMFLPKSFLENVIPAFPQILGWSLLSQGLFVFLRILFFRWLSPKFGKFRIWIITGWLPAFVFMMLIVYLPFQSMAYINRLWILNCLFGMYTFFRPFIDQRGAMQNVISPNSNERVKINTIIVTVLAPVYGIMNILTPIFATFTGGLTSLQTYRILTPILFGVGIPLTLFMAFGVKDKIILEKKHKTEISMFSGFKEVIRNKYLWMMYISDNISAFSWGVVNIENVIIIYAMRQDWSVGIIATVTGFFAFPGLFLAPLLIRKMGKRNVVLLGRGLFYSYFICAFAAIALNNIYLMFLGMILSNLFSSSQSIARDSINPDIWDYQQYISGQRLESSTGILNTIGSPIVTLMSITVPLLYEKIGFTNDWNMLYEPTMRNTVFYVTLGLSALGHTVATIPYFFYNLTEKKHAEIMKELKARADKLDAEQAANENIGNAEVAIAAATSSGNGDCNMGGNVDEE